MEVSLLDAYASFEIDTDNIGDVYAQTENFTDSLKRKSTTQLKKVLDARETRNKADSKKRKTQDETEAESGGSGPSKEQPASSGGRDETRGGHSRGKSTGTRSRRRGGVGGWTHKPSNGEEVRASSVQGDRPPEMLRQLPLSASASKSSDGKEGTNVETWVEQLPSDGKLSGNLQENVTTGSSHSFFDELPPTERSEGDAVFDIRNIMAVMDEKKFIIEFADSRTIDDEIRGQRADRARLYD